jgi:hypothetical protein
MAILTPQIPGSDTVFRASAMAELAMWVEAGTTGNNHFPSRMRCSDNLQYSGLSSIPM